MKLVLLSGGSGKRLWPLSNDARSKQFLKVLENDKQDFCSMVQRVYGQLEKVSLDTSTVIATSKSQVEMIHNQLGDNVPLIVEPTRRDTFPAIALAATYLYSVQGASLNDVVSVLPVDPYVDDHFFNRITDLEKLLQETNADLALMGVKPTYPSSKYGYIVPDGEHGSEDYIKVNGFTEKPTEEQAKALIENSALWNCGVFAFKLDYIISKLEAQGLPIQYDELSKQFDNLPKISFDYEVVEKANSIVALPYEGYWKDLGTWNTLTEEMATNQLGKGIISGDSENTHLINELDIPVTVLGVSNAVVAVSPDGILVADKEQSPRIKEVMNGFEQRPMYEERLWGSYKVLDYTRYEENEQEVLTKRVKVKSGKHISYQYHELRQEVWTIVNGEGLFAIDGEIKPVKVGDVLSIPQGVAHAIKATTDLELIEVQTGSQLVEADINRIYMTWEEVELNSQFVQG
ncbi:sugar phosphate nucleotidyltransferase [Terrilactibacillus laevilacticus]|uniref:sugar phosphate nucleotidyltransferase n=1 Tax=Terrilactibacillus laevilacticus TaxID=1380157 RepID=UPI00114730F3|nr:sugar phosphate nucleotidyltransferase [Terrilactibacillus laevilacticus]